MRRKAIRLGVALALALSVIVPAAGSAGAAPPVRDNSSARPVYFVPGFSTSGSHDCWFGYWKAAGEAMWSYGWTGSYHTVSFYAPDTNCNTKIYNGDRNTPINDLGRLLAWNIYSSYSKNGISVDVIAHSMGGLVIRAALTGVARKLQGWPPYLYVEDVTTINTPHRGTNLADLCDTLGRFQQCRDMIPGSSFLNSLYDAPQSAQGTDWTLIGSDDDDIVSTESALGMSAGHKVAYQSGQGIEHGSVHQTTTGSYGQWYWNYYDNKWNWTTAGAPPVRVANNAIYYWWKW
ncbi:esterase/lipase family protein [Actinocrispum wychmicini]|uniref:PGAP1-like protein n=1 Tax=Actinocrispum wychmicini TaxID=1213861 RepID=A0A4R2JED3_9PSEU|nr:hypothetical protein [Actinocrispum wychmicini]TCO52615.1 PGAP1-like protein [Actinocrispum wychmicini]